MHLSNSNEIYAAIDLGSNSFHMVVANYVDGQVLIVDRIKEMVRLAGGLNDDQYITEETMQTALQCIERFAQRIKSIPISNIRSVGTNTLRQARNGIDFLNRASISLGYKIEIISGREEARLIYLGVANTIFNDKKKRLIIDIGGGSTEFIIGQNFDAHITESLFIGCVNISQQFFENGEITPKRIRKARIFVLQELENIKGHYCRYGWDMVIGTSGTIRTIFEVLVEKAWGNTVITVDALLKLNKALTKCKHINEINFTALSSNRKSVFIGGVIILSAVFEALDIQNMEYSNGALREGLLYDLINRQHDKDIREETVKRLMNRYSVDEEHASRVNKSVRKIFNAASTVWGLDKKDDFKMVCWAAKLHEIGLAISHSQYHKHGAYLLNYSDLSGFSRQEQNILSILVRAHRRKFPIDIFNQIIEPGIQNKLIRLSIILRLAIVLNRSRNSVRLSEIEFDIKDKSITLNLTEGWLAKNPLTEADVETEIDYLSSTNYKLIYSAGNID